MVKNLPDKQNERYKSFVKSKCRNGTNKLIRQDDNVSSTTNIKLLITANILRNKFRDVLNWITQLKTGNGALENIHRKEKFQLITTNVNAESLKLYNIL